MILVAFAVGPAALVLSTVPPAVVKLRLRSLEQTGQTVGRLSAVGTLGALAGTFLTGFVLLSAFPTSTLLLLTGLTLLVCGAATALALGRMPRTPAGGAARARRAERVLAGRGRQHLPGGDPLLLRQRQQ